jgi:DNA invertase Pin-like site-specific DNA recombinase
MATLPRAYSYVRFSTPEQAKGDSLRRQTELSNRYAEVHGLTIDTSLSLHDKGLSGFTGENRSKGALSVFLKAVEAGLVPVGSFLLVESLDRFSRDTLSEQMGLFIGLINAGLTVVTLADGQRYSKTTIDSDLSKLMLSLVVMMRAYEESLTKSRRLKAAWEDKRRRISEEKLSSCCPSWLRLAADRTRFVVIRERAELVNRVYQMSLDGYGVTLIARTLNSEGIPSWSRGHGWHVSFVHRLLRNRAVLGEFQPLRHEGSRSVSVGAPVSDYYPQIVEASTWQKAQERRLTSTPGRTPKGKPGH